MIRLHLTDDLSAGAEIAPAADQAHYLVTVMRANGPGGLPGTRLPGTGLPGTRLPCTGLPRAGLPRTRVHAAWHRTVRRDRRAGPGTRGR